MNEYIKQISDRIRELRDILDLTAEEVATGCGVSTEEYLAYENGEKEIPISILYKVATASRSSVIPAIHSAPSPSITSTDRWIR